MLSIIESKLESRIRAVFYISFITILIYSNSLAAPYTLDDFRSITDNSAIRNPLDFPALWNFYSNRFILYFSLALNYSIHQYNVLGYHIVNMLIHIFNGVLVYIILKTILDFDYFNGSRIRSFKNTVSFMGALLFIGHPVQVNAVTYIIQRTTSLAAMFYLLAVFYFIKFRLQSKRSYFLYLLLFIILAMFTKENTFSIPFMLLAIELTFFQGKFKKKDVLFWGAVLLTLLIIPIAKYFQGGSISDPNNSFKASTDMSRYTYLLTEFNVIMTYIRLLLIPVNQNLDYDYPLSHSFLQYPTYISFLIIIFLFIFAFLCIRRNKLITLGIFWFFIGLSVESTIIAINDVIFEHRLYLPILGFILFLTGILEYLIKTNNLKILRLFIIMVILSLSTNFILTYKRNEVFSNSITLWEDVVKKSPNKWRSHSSLGSNYIDIGNFEKAEKELRIALSLNSDDTTAYLNLSKLYSFKKNYEASGSYALEAIKKGDKSGYGYYYLALSAYNQGDTVKAFTQINKALELNPKLSIASKLLNEINSKN